MQIETRGTSVDPQGRIKEQLCVPTVVIRGNSYRLKEKLKAGLIRTEEPVAIG